MNFVDVLVALLIISSFARGYQIGMVRQLGSSLGFVIGFIVSIPLAPLVGEFVSDEPKLLASSIATIILIFAGMVFGEWVGARFKNQVQRGETINKIDNIVGSSVAALSFGLTLWIGFALIALLPSSTAVSTIKNSYIFGVIDRNLPPAAQLLSVMNHIVEPEGEPTVFDEREPSPDAQRQLPSISAYERIFNQASQSTVRVQGLGCGGIVNGTGFVIGSDRVITNAHVIAGVDHPKIHSREGTHDAIPVYFDAEHDIAVLKTKGLKANPLRMNATPLEDGATALTIGYPGGGAQARQVISAIKTTDARGKDIYSQGRVTRNVILLQSNLIPGNSGGPIIDESGVVRGIIFATSTANNNIGYGLTLPQVMEGVESSKTAIKALDTGPCSTM